MRASSRWRSIPTVYALFQGQPVADLTSARSESELKQTLDQLLAQLPIGGEAGEAKAEIAQFITMAEQIMGEGDPQRAAGIFGQVVEMAPDNAEAHAGLVRALAQAGQAEEARAALAMAESNPAVAADPHLAQAKSAVDLLAERPDEGELTALREKAAADPADMNVRLAYAEAAFAAGQRDAAGDELLAMIETDREWNEGAARAKLVQIFEAVGLEDPWVVATRRRLSRLLFG